MDLTRNPIIKGSEPVVNEGMLPVELQSPNIVHPSYQTIVAPNVTNGRYQEIHPQVKGEPSVTIVEQPQQRGFRFRYECEGPSHGGLQGVKSARGKKSYPTIKINNYTGDARVVVTLMTDEKNPRCHAHKLVGTNCRNGTGMMEVQANSEPVSFPNLCILHVTRKKLVDVLTERILDTMRLSKKLKANNMNLEPEITEEDRELAKSQAQDQSKSMQLNVVRLCFQVFLRNPDSSFGRMLTPVVSQPIYDSKSPGASALKICRMDKYGGCCSGNEEVFLLCEKVQKDDIMVRFVEQTPDGKVKWESYGNFGPLDVHRQYAIVFKTPAYHNKNIDKPVNVFIMLQRRSDQESSEPFAFTYFPQNRDRDNIASKKRKRIPLDSYDDFGDSGGGGGFGGSGFGGGGDMDDDVDGEGGGDNHTGRFIYIDNTSGMNHQPSQLSTSKDQTPQFNIPISVIQDSIGSPDEEISFASTQEVKGQSVSSAVEPLSSDDNLSLEENSPDTELEIEEKGLPCSREEKISLPSTSPCPSTKSNDPILPSNDEFHPQDPHKPDKTSPLLTSVDFLDSGLDTQSTKSSILSSDKQEIISPTSSVCESKNNRKPEKGSPSKLLTHSDTELKVENVVIKSDEGFSESVTSIETQFLINSPVKKEDKSIDQSVKVERQVSGTTDKLADRVTAMMKAGLRDYVETGNILYLLLAQRHLMVAANDNGDLPLHLAIINGQLHAVCSLLKIMSTLPGAKNHIDSVNLLRQTPLHLATVLGQQAIVEMLLHCGADPAKADRNGNTAPHLAIQYNQQACLATLVKYVRPGNSRLNPFPELNHLNFEGYSSTHLAAMTGSVPILKRLVFGQADVNLPDGKSGKTCLHHAVDNEDLAITQYLLTQTRCDVNARCFDGNTALHIACSRQQVALVVLLVAGGADVEAENEEIPDLDTMEDGVVSGRRGHTPADYADGNEKILSILDKDYSSFDPTDPPYLSSSPAVIAQRGSNAVNANRDIKKDFVSLSLKSRIELSRLLDPNVKDIEALTDRLKVVGLNPTWKDVVTSGGSPTTFILEYMESHNASVKTLSESLVEIGRKDAADLIGL